jgi:sec-independent protein translocase protein TatA
MRIGPFGVWEILIILVVVLLIFGPRRLPEMAKGLGQSVRAFRKELRDMRSDLDGDDEPRSTNKASQASTAAPGASGPSGGSSGTADAPREGSNPQGGGSAAS